MTGGFGTASLSLPGGGLVAAAAAVNAFGGIYDPDSGLPVAGPRGEPPEEGILDTVDYLRKRGGRSRVFQTRGRIRRSPSWRRMSG